MTGRRLPRKQSSSLDQEDFFRFDSNIIIFETWVTSACLMESTPSMCSSTYVGWDT